MYNCCMKRVFLILFVFFIGTSSYASFIPNIPSATLEAAREAEIRQAFEKPKSDIVRVGIGDNSFKNYSYKNIGIFGTSHIKIFVNDIEFADIPAHSIVNVIYKNGNFTIENGEVIDDVSGTVRFTCKHGQLGIGGLKRAGGQALYRGDIELVKFKDDTFNVVNVLEVEDYLKGVVPNEMPVRFGLEALKAQSVAARNYVLSPRVKANPSYDVVDSVASQVYYGYGSEKDLGTKAVEETEGIVAIYGWDLILAQYSSTAGGYTESFSNVFSDPVTKMFPSVPKPYLVAKPDTPEQFPLNMEEDALAYYKSTPDSFDVKSPYFRWQRIWTREDLQKAVQANLPAQSVTGFIKPAFGRGQVLPEIVRLDVKKRGDSGKIIELDIVTKKGTYKVMKELVIRRLLTNNGKALPSANVAFEHKFDSNGRLISVTAFGGGYGHGVGMSQYGAGFMATELKMPYYKILKHYYNGITLATKPVIISSDNRVVNQHFFVKEKSAELVVDNKYKLSYFLVNINGKEHKITLNKDERVQRIDVSAYLKHGHNTITYMYPTDEDAGKGIRLFAELVKKDE